MPVLHLISNVNRCVSRHEHNTAKTEMSNPQKVGGTQHRTSPLLQKNGGHVPLSTHGLTPIHETVVQQRLEGVAGHLMIML